MARPAKTPEERRDNQINTALTDAERAEIERSASLRGMTAPDFIRRRALGNPLPATVPEQRDQARRLDALNRLAVNLNQIARHMNAGRGAPSWLSDLIARINTMLDEIHGPDDHGGRAVL